MNGDVVRCNQCYAVFVESVIELRDDEEVCPECGKTGALMDMAGVGVMNVYTVTRDGVTVATLPNETAAWGWLLGHVGYSVHHAVTYEGWDVIGPDGSSLAASLTGGKP